MEKAELLNRGWIEAEISCVVVPMEKSGDAGQSSKVEEMLSQLKLTAEERNAMAVDDIVLEGLATSDRAIIGKVLSTNVLHIQTIMSVLRPAWGNPRGLDVMSVGENIFMAEFGSKQDRDRILDGSPWTIGKKAGLLQQFDPSLRPSEVSFDKMAIWVRIYYIPFGYMNNEWGEVMAGRVGKVLKLEVDANGKAWGPFLRAKVQVDINKPLLRCVTVFSEKKQRADQFDVRYEKLPNYCYLCGILGHSSVVCLNPAERDENGILPYGIDLRAMEDSKQKKGSEERSSNSASRSFNSADQRGSTEDHHENNGATNKEIMGTQATNVVRNISVQENEALSQLKCNNRKEKKVIVQDENQKVGKELLPKISRGQGTKRKQGRAPTSRLRKGAINQHDELSQDAMDLIVAIPETERQQIQAMEVIQSEVELEEDGEDMKKKLRTSGINADESAAAADKQPRREP